MGGKLRYIRFRRRNTRKNGSYSFGRLSPEQLEPRQLLAAQPVITEFLAGNNDHSLDGDGNASDWIEIYNAGDESTDLSGYRLTDDSDDLSKWMFPKVELPAKQYMVVYASGQQAPDYVDAAGNLHATFGLDSDGEYLGLVSPSGDIISEFRQDNGSFPPQVTDSSFGFAQAATVIHPGSGSHYWVPGNDSLGTSWTEVGFDPLAHGFQPGTMALGLESRPDDRRNFVGQFSTELAEGTHAVYVHSKFTIDSAADVSSLKLRLKYDNGYVIYLNGQEVLRDNAPDRLSWFSQAVGNSPSDRSAIQFVELDLSEHRDKLVDGENVFAVHGLNHLPDGTDMLLAAELTIDLPVDQAPVGYLQTPTPGVANFSLLSLAGPLVDEVTDNPGAIADDQEVVVTARVRPLNDSVSGVTLAYRSMYESEVLVAMSDDGVGADSTANDGIYSAVIPADAAAPGEMIRWRVLAEDTGGNRSRSPLFLDQEGVKHSAEYYGTVVTDAEVSSKLPILQWFTDNPSGARSRGGARASVFYAGEFYDNVYVRQRGGATNGNSQKFIFNSGEELWVDERLGRVGEFNLNAQGWDPSFIRQTLAFRAYTDAGNESSDSFLMHVRRNNEFDRVGVFIEQVDEDFLKRHDLDPEGALYKFVQRGNLGSVFSDTVTGIEKKTRVDDDNSDVEALVAGLNQRSDEAKKQFLFDNLNLPQLLNYLAVRSITLEADDVRKNFYMYRDTNGSGEWSIFPWDKDWTFGIEGDGGTHLRHPFFGDRDHAKQNANQWNTLLTVVFAEPATREMYLRRLRSVMDQFLQSADTPEEDLHFEARIEELRVLAEDELSRGALRAIGTITTKDSTRPERTFLGRRRTDLFVNHSIQNPDFRDNAGIPDAQIGNPNIEFGQIEFNPASGNQDEEFIQLTNPNDVAVDISHWTLTGGVEHTFRAGTVIPAGGSVYVSPNVSAFRGRASGPGGGQSLFVQGNYRGHLSNFGETIVLSAGDGTSVASVETPFAPSDAQLYLRVTEVHYNPDGNDATEFVELQNTSSGDSATPLDLTGVKITDGPREPYQFPEGTMLDAGQRIVVVKSPSDFRAANPSVPETSIFGPFLGSLSNGGERIKVEDATGSTISDFAYDDDWYLDADGQGYSLVVNDVAADYNQSTSWRPSVALGGSPAAGEPFPLVAGDANRDGQFSAPDIVLVLQSAKYLTNEDALWSEGDWNGDGVFDPWDLVEALKGSA